jgi:PASTA domain-containing protein
MAERKTDPRPISPDKAADLIRDAGTVSGLAQVGILSHADEIAASQSVRLNRESLRLARKYGVGSPEAIRAGSRVDQHKSYRRALAAELDRATIPVPPSDPDAATVYGRVFSADGKPQSGKTIEAADDEGKVLASAAAGTDGTYLMRIPLKVPQNVSLRVLAGDKKNPEAVLESDPVRVDKGLRVFRDLRIAPPQTAPKPRPGGSGPPPAALEMPDLTKLSEHDARAVLERLGVTSIRTTTEIAATTAPGTVLKQTPAKGTALKTSTRVTLAVSARPPAKMPNLGGMTLQNATITLNQLGLKVGKVTGDQEKGRVTGQTPDAGEDAPSGGLVDLRLGRTG